MPPMTISKFPMPQKSAPTCSSRSRNSRSWPSRSIRPDGRQLVFVLRDDSVMRSKNFCQIRFSVVVVLVVSVLVLVLCRLCPYHHHHPDHHHLIAISSPMSDHNHQHHNHYRNHNHLLLISSEMYHHRKNHPMFLHHLDHHFHHHRHHHDDLHRRRHHGHRHHHQFCNSKVMERKIVSRILVYLVIKTCKAICTQAIATHQLVETASSSCRGCVPYHPPLPNCFFFFSHLQLCKMTPLLGS